MSREGGEGGEGGEEILQLISLFDPVIIYALLFNYN
jgi:hypothetical protein